MIASMRYSLSAALPSARRAARIVSRMRRTFSSQLLGVNLSRCEEFALFSEIPSESEPRKMKITYLNRKIKQTYVKPSKKFLK